VTAGSDPADLISLAEKSLDGTVPVPGGRAARAAAVVSRQALEQVVAGRCDELVTGLQRPSMRSQLILLREIGDSEIGPTAQIAWDGLSRACHHHAYELQPTVDEVHGLVNLVRQIALAGSEVVRPIV